MRPNHSSPSRPSFWPILGALALLACSHAPATSGQAGAPTSPETGSTEAKAPEPIPALKLPTDVRPTHYALAMTVDPAKDRFEGTAAIDVTLEKPRSTLWINGRDLEITQAFVERDGQRWKADWKQVTPAGVVRLTLPVELKPGKATLHLAWSHVFENRAVGLYKTEEAGIPYASTQFEAVDARRAFPGFDQPEFKTPFDLTLTIPSEGVAIANTREVETKAAPGGMKTLRFQTTRPLPTYLVAFAVGPWEVVDGPTLPPNALRDHPLPTRGVAPKGRGAELKFALEAGAQIIAAEEQYFQIAYPYPKLDQIAVPDFAYGAMENAGAITYREQVLLFDPKTSAPSDRMEIASVMAHEMAHQWFGDLVTMPFWTDAWLNESFATWMAARTLQRWNPGIGPVRESLLEEIQGAMSQDALPSARAIRQPLTRIEEVWNQFDQLTYEKGAALLGMFERWAGEEKFRKGIHDYLVAHAWGSGSTDDLLASLSRAAGQNLALPFHSFLDQSGLPLVSVKPVCDAEGARLELSQKAYAPLGVKAPGDKLWGIPICVRYAAAGAERETCNLLARQSESVRLEACPDWVFPNTDASGYYRWALGGPWLKKLEGKGAGKLSKLEQLDLIDNLEAGVRSGSVPIADAFGAMVPYTRTLDPALVSPAMGVLSSARDHLVPESLRPKVEAWGQAIFSPLWPKVGWTAQPTEPTARGMLRHTLLQFLTLSMHDPKLSAEAAKRGRAYAAVGEKGLNEEAVAPELAGTALGVAVRDGDGALFDALLAKLPSLADARLRSRILTALPFTRDPKRFEKALSLSVDPSLRANERPLPLFVGATVPETREATWRFFQEHYDLIIQGIPPPLAGVAPQLFGGFCDEDHAAQLEAFFRPKLGEQKEVALPLAHAVEQIRICAAVKAAQEKSAEALFQKPPPKG